MNIPIKTKTTATRARSKSRSTSKVVALSHAKRPILRHFRLVDNKHTARLIHFRHTSHVALVGILVFVGFFLFISSEITSAITSDGTVTIGLTVNGPAPSTGAVITSPVNGVNIIDQKTLLISGTCQASTFVVIQDNGQIVGSTTCNNDGTFILTVQLELGTNIFSALNYDNLNQPGPDTLPVAMTVTESEPVIPVTPVVPVVPIVPPVLPINPSIIPGVKSSLSSCDKFKTGLLPVGGDVHVAIVCIPRLFGPKIEQTVGILVWGGTPPYSISIDWGNGLENTTINIPTAGYYTKSFNYDFPGIYRVDFLVKDKKGTSAVVQSSVQVNGVLPTSSTTDKDDNALMSWLKTPVPLYIMAVALTFGFWGGDIFIRKLTIAPKKHQHRTKKAA